MIQHDTRLTPVHQGSLERETHSASLSAIATSFSRPNDIRYYLTLILKRKWFILSVVIIVTSLVSLYAFSLPSIYEATATLRLQPREYTFMESGGATVFHGYDSYEYSNTQVKLLSNSELMRQVTLDLDLQNDAVFLGEKKVDFFSRIRTIFAREKPSVAPPAVPVVRSDPSTDVRKLGPEQVAQMEPYVNALLSNLKVELQENTNLVNVRFTHTNPETAFRVLETLAKDFRDSDKDFETAGTQTAANTLAKQVADVQAALKQQEEQRIAYLKGHNLPLSQGQGRNLTAERLGTLSAQLLAAENERKNLEALNESARSAKDIWSVPQVRDSKDIQELRKTIRELEQKRAALIEVYTPNWPEVKKIDSQLRQLNESIKASANEALTALKSNYQAAVAREKKLREAYEKEKGAANHQSQDEVELASLNQRIETNKQIYNTLFQRQKELEINASDKSSRVSVATPPAIPLAPIGPPRLSKVLVAFFLSLIAGIGLAFLMSQLDNGLKSAEDVANYTYLPTLALIPANRRSVSSSVRGFLGSKAPQSTAPALTRDVRSPSSEAYRQLRTSLLFNSSGRMPKSILVTSGRPLEGKTTTAINMAITFAQTGADVLLIDCDLRRPRVHLHFDLPNTEGFTDYVFGETDLEGLLHPYKEQPNLKLMMAGSLPPNPADFLGSNETRRLIEALKETFTYVIIDSPPASSFADAAILSTLVDGVVIVVHGQRSSRVVVRKVKERLLEVGARIYGVVLNCVDLEGDEYYSGYYYTNYYAKENNGR